MRRLLALTVIALGVAASAAAEPPLGSRLGSRERANGQAAEAKAAAQGHAAAKCIVNKRRQSTERMLSSTDPATVKKAYKDLWAGDLTCYSGFEDNDSGFVEGRVIDAPFDVMRGMLAEELVRRDAATVGRLPVLQPLHQIYSRPWYAVTARDPIVDEMATCVADVNPVGTLALFQTDAYTDGEMAVVRNLSADFGRCLRAGARLTANRQALRAALAEALYQRTQPWPVQAPTPTPAAPPTPAAHQEHGR
jgi:hypothetical protein